jgi:hypothetical protein
MLFTSLIRLRRGSRTLFRNDLFDKCLAVECRLLGRLYSASSASGQDVEDAAQRGSPNAMRASETRAAFGFATLVHEE